MARPVEQSVPHHINAQEFAERWPYATVKIIRGGVAVECKGRVIGRTIERTPRYDLILEDRSIVSNMDAVDVTILPRDSTPAAVGTGK